MGRMIYFTIMLVLLGSWLIGTFYLEEQYYIHSLLVMAGLISWFRYVYQMKPANG